MDNCDDQRQVLSKNQSKRNLLKCIPTRTVMMTNNDVYQKINDALTKTYSYPERFDSEIVTVLYAAANAGHLPQSYQQCLALLEQGCSELRIIVLALYSSDCWLTKQGLLALLLLCRELLDTPAAQLTAPGVLSTKQTFTHFYDHQLAWLLHKINRKLNFLVEQKKPAWLNFLTELDQESLRMLIAELKLLVQALNERQSEQACEQVSKPLDDEFSKNNSQALLEVQALLQYFAEIEPSALAAQDLTSDDGEGLEGSESSDISQSELDRLLAGEEVVEKADVNTASLLPSAQQLSSCIACNSEQPAYALQQLLEKLDCFQRLLSAEDHFKASIVALDINQLLENFDAKLYFPELFRAFLTGQIQHQARLQQAQMAQQQYDIQPLSDLYHIDRAAFMALDSELTDLGIMDGH